jgi:phosphoribosyl-AMP cyclohydrolase
MQINEQILNCIDFTKGHGLISVIAQDIHDNEILMIAYMNQESLLRTLELEEAVYWSRSRGCLWHKGETSGNVQKVKEIYLDCDGDALLLKVEQVGNAACHTGKRSCFYRRIRDNVIQDVGVKIFDPKQVYSK